MIKTASPYPERALWKIRVPAISRISENVPNFCKKIMTLKEFAGAKNVHNIKKCSRICKKSSHFPQIFVN